VSGESLAADCGGRDRFGRPASPPPGARENAAGPTRICVTTALGKAVAYHVARTNQHVAAAAQFDAGAMHMPVDLRTA
jgi:hypothetical protein